jgi:hypothetical protein
MSAQRARVYLAEAAMKVTNPILALVTVVAGAYGGAALAQMPFPFGGPQVPQPNQVRQCTKDYIKSVETQITALEKMRAAGPQFVGQVCSLIESGSTMLGGELPDTWRQQLKGLLGVDVDLRFIKTQCRVAQGNIDRELMTQLGSLRLELVRCNDTI